MTRRALWGILFLLALVLGAWWFSDKQAAEPFGPPPPPVSAICKEHIFEGARFTACPAAPDTSTISLALLGSDGKPLRHLSALKAEMDKQGRAPLFAMNAGMYDDQSEPIGLYLADGKQRKALNRKAGEGNFHLLPNGVFWVDDAGRFHVDTADQYSKRAARTTPLLATQSGPMLVIDGKLHPKITADGPSRYRRNGVGLDAKGTAWFVMSDEPVSFGKFARFFRDQLKCPDALYFDGSVSALWVPDADRLDLGAALGPMIMVERRRR